MKKLILILLFPFCVNAQGLEKIVNDSLTQASLIEDIQKATENPFPGYLEKVIANYDSMGYVFSSPDGWTLAVIDTFWFPEGTVAKLIDGNWNYSNFGFDGLFPYPFKNGEAVRPTRAKFKRIVVNRNTKRIRIEPRDRKNPSRGYLAGNLPNNAFPGKANAEKRLKDRKDKN